MAPPRERLLIPILIAVAAVPALVIALWVRSTGPMDHSAGWMPWAFLGMGVFGIADALFDRKQQGGGGKAALLAQAIGPVAMRFVWAVIGGGFLGGGIGVLLVSP